MNKEPAVRAINKKGTLYSFAQNVILYSAPDTLEYHKNVLCNCINILRFNIFKWNIVILWYENFIIKVSPKNNIPIEKYDNWKIITPLIWKRKFKIRHRSTLRYKMPFWYLIRVIQTRLHAKGFVVPMGGTIVFITFSNYNELCTKYRLLSIFFYTSYRHPTKGVMFSDS